MNCPEMRRRSTAVVAIAVLLVSVLGACSPAPSSARAAATLPSPGVSADQGQGSAGGGSSAAASVQAAAPTSSAGTTWPAPTASCGAHAASWRLPGSPADDLLAVAALDDCRLAIAAPGTLQIATADGLTTLDDHTGVESPLIAADGDTIWLADAAAEAPLHVLRYTEHGRSEVTLPTAVSSIDDWAASDGGLLLAASLPGKPQLGDADSAELRRDLAADDDTVIGQWLSISAAGKVTSRPTVLDQSVELFALGGERIVGVSGTDLMHGTNPTETEQATLGALTPGVYRMWRSGMMVTELTSLFASDRSASDAGAATDLTPVAGHVAVAAIAASDHHAIVALNDLDSAQNFTAARYVRLADDGHTWRTLAPLKKAGVTGVGYAGTMVLAAMDRPDLGSAGVWQSLDDGATWTARPDLADGDESVSLVPAPSGLFVLADRAVRFVPAA